MNTHRLTPLLAALASALPFALQAQSTGDTDQRLRQLQEVVGRMQQRIDELEAARAKPPGATWGMSPEQVRELNQVTVKAAGIEDALETQGWRGLKVSGYIDPTYLAARNQNRRGFQFLDSASNGEYAIDNGSFGTAQLEGAVIAARGVDDLVARVLREGERDLGGSRIPLRKENLVRR